MAKFTLTAQLSLLPPTSSQLQGIVNTINKSLSNITANVNINLPKNLSTQLTGLNKNFTNTKKQVEATTDSIEHFGKQSALAIRRFAAFSLATGGIIGLGVAFKKSFSEAIKFDREVVRIAQVTGKSVEGLKDLTDEITRLSTGFGVSSSKIANVAVTLSQAGISVQDTKKALETLAKTELSATFDDIVDTTEGAIAIMAQFGTSVNDLEKDLGAINAVSARFAVESSDLITAVRRTGGAFKASGGSLNELIALFTSVRATTRESAESIATGFRTIFTRIQRPRTVEFLKSLGVELRDLSGQFVGPFQAVEKLSQALKELPSTDPRFAQIIEELGGFRQVSKVIPLIQQFETSQKALNVAQRSGASLTDDAAKAQQALAVQIAKLSEEFDALLRKIANNSGIRSFIDLTLKLASSLIKVTDALTPLLPLLLGLGTTAVFGRANSFVKGFKPNLIGTGKNQGGPIGFSRGGFVPGAGNRDTVPAMLEPGEFVLRKRAANALGPKTLNKFNKYAKGGKVDFGAVGLFGNDDEREYPIKVGKDTYTAHISSAVVGNDKGKTLEKRIIRPAIIGSILDSAQSLGNEIGAKVNTPDAVRSIKKFNFASTAGSVFESALGALGAPYDEDAEIQDNFDFPKGIGKLSGLFGKAGLATIPTDAKRTLSAETVRKKVLSKAEKYISALVGFGGGAPGEELNLGQIQEKLLQTGFISKQQVAKGISSEALSNKFRLVTKQLPDKFEDVGKGVFKRKARGGGISGSDTVPAMLTPGEFVVNKKSAAKIGLGNLHKMNRFAKGGPVGGIGGFIQNKPFEAAFIGAQLTTIVGNLSGFGDGLNSVIGNLGALTAQVILLKTALRNNPLSKINFGEAIAKSGARLDAASKQLGEIQSRRAKLEKIYLARQQQIQANPGNPLPPLKAGATAQKIQDLTDRQNKVQGRVKRRADQFTKLSKAERLDTRAQNITAVAGAAAITGGNLLSEFGLNQLKITGGKKGATTAKAGGILAGAGSGAVGGAIVGSAIAPGIGTAIGAAAGGIAGALVGLHLTIKDVNSQINKIHIDASIAKLNTALTRVSSGRASAESQRTDVIDSLEELRKKFNSIGNSSDDLQNLQGEVDNSLNSIESFLKNLAASSSTFNEFQTKAGSSIRNFSLLGRIPLKDIEEQFKKQIETQNKLNAVNTESLRLQSLAARRLQFLVDLGGAFKDLELEADILVNSLDTASNKLTDRSSVFGRIGEIGNTKQLNIATDEVSNLLGPLGKELGDQLKASNTVFRELPQILIETARKGLGAEGHDFESAIETRLADVLKGVSPDVAKGILSQVNNAIKQEIGSEVKDQKIIEEALRNPIALTRKLVGDATGELSKIFAEASASITNSSNKILDAFGKRAALEEKLVQGLINIVDLTEGKASLIAQFNDTTIGVGQVKAFDTARQNILLGNAGLGGGFANNPAAVGGQLGALTKQRDELHGKLENGLIPRTEGNVAALGELNTKIEATTKVLEFFGNVSQRAAGLQNELNKEIENRRTKQDILRGIATGDARSRAANTLTLFQAQQAAKAGTLKGVNPLISEKILNFLESKPKDFEIFGGKAGDIFKKLLGSLIGDENVAASQKEKDIQGELLKVQQQAIDAQVQLSKTTENALSLNREQIEALKANTAQLKANLDKQTREQTQKEIAGLEADRQKIVGKVGAANVLGGFGFNGKNLADIKRAADLVKEGKDIHEKGATARNFRLSSLTPTGEVNLSNLPDIAAAIQDKLLRSGIFDPKKVAEIGPAIVGDLDNFANRLGGGTLDQNEVRKAIERLLKNNLGADLEEAQGIGPKAIAAKRGREEELGKLGVGDASKFAANIDAISSALETFGNTDVPALGKEFEALTQQIDILKERLKQPVTEGPPLNRAMGGTVPGFGDRDSVPAMLTPGEFVINKASAAAIGLGQLHEMNRFAKGGPVKRRPTIQEAQAKVANRIQAKIEAANERRAAIEAFRESKKNPNRPGKLILRSPEVKEKTKFVRPTRDDAQGKIANRIQKKIESKNELRHNVEVFRELKKQSNIETRIDEMEKRKNELPVDPTGNPLVPKPPKERVKFARGGMVHPKMADAIAKARANRIAIAIKKSKARATRLDAAFRFRMNAADAQRRRMSGSEPAILEAKAIEKTRDPNFFANAGITSNLVRTPSRFASSPEESNRRRDAILTQRKASGIIPPSNNFGPSNLNIHTRILNSERRQDLIIAQRKTDRRGDLSNVNRLTAAGRRRVSSPASANAIPRVPLDAPKFKFTRPRGSSIDQRVSRAISGVGGRRAFATGGLVTGGGGGSINTDSFNASVVAFSNTASNLANSLNAFPRSIELSARHTVEVIFNGAEVLSRLLPTIQEIAVSEAQTAINKMIKNKIPDIGTV